MTEAEGNQYIRTIVAQHTPSVLAVPPIIDALRPHINTWANGFDYEIKLSGSYAKGTAITQTTDLDLFISLHPDVGDYNTLENVFDTLRNRFLGAGYTVREQNVSIGIGHQTFKIDLVAGVKHHVLGLDHSIWKRKAKTWTKTNINDHINLVAGSGRVLDIKAVKIWRKLRNLDFPSFYLELSVIEALKGRSLSGSPLNDFVAVMTYLSSDFLTKRIEDPSNSSNVVSEELTDDEKEIISNAAVQTLNENLEQALW